MLADSRLTRQLRSVQVRQPIQPVAVEQATGRGKGVRPAKHPGQQLVISHG
jgi:hypothetical protein